MGDAKAGPVRFSFNPQLRVEFHGSTVTSDAGLLLPRELDEHLGLSALIERHWSCPGLVDGELLSLHTSGGSRFSFWKIDAASPATAIPP